VPQNTIVPAIQCANATLHPGTQGIKRVAVDDSNARLTVVFLAPITSQQSYLFKPQSYSLTGGQRLFPRLLKAEPGALASPPGFQEPSVMLTLDGPGDFSIYTLTVSGPDIDPFFSSAKLRFRLACDELFDCQTPAAQQASQPDVPVVVDYLAKDYSSFRQALLDFIPTRLPAWTERSEADIGMMLLELFASTADNLSYLQDRVANEAFLTTATQRRSVAGHLALLGYQMDEGASAHTWLQFQVNTQQTLSGNPGFKVSNQPITSDEPVIVFETLGNAALDPVHNQMALFDWGNSNCYLPRTAFSAALAGSYTRLKAGDYLLFDNGGGNRDIVRLSASPQVFSVAQVMPGTLGSPPSGFVTIVNWSPATPLQNNYCVACTIVRGNVVPATHGETVNETLRFLTPEQRAQTEFQIAARQPWQRIPRQRLQLSNAPLAHLDPQTLSLGEPLTAQAADTNQTSSGQNVAPASRSISTLQLFVDDVPRQEQTTLLTALADSQVFKVEINETGQATVVFGDDVFGQSPSETATITAIYRIGGGQNGNVGADTLTVAHPDVPAPWLVSVTNPLPATGGRDLESADHARRFGPPLSHQPLVAVSSADYQTAAAAFVDASGQQPVQRTQAGFEWTGSWLTVTLAVDPAGTDGLPPVLAGELQTYLATKRLAGYDLQITGPAYLPIDLAIQFAIAPGSQSSSVQQTLEQVLSNSVLPDGSKGFFHPDNFTFGLNLYVSKIFAAVMGVPGVQSAQITRLAQLHSAQPDAETAANLAKGFLAAGADQIIRLDNNRNFPQNGTLTVIPMVAAT
jgi:hypothetical protein